MNDEEFARSVFTRTFESETTDEPSTLPSIDQIAAHARRSLRTRQGVYAAGTVALAGVVTAGVVGGPGALGLGGDSGKRSSAAGQTSSGTPTVKGKTATPCAASPQALAWASLIEPQLPAGMGVTPGRHAPGFGGVSCMVQGDGSISMESTFTITPGGVLQVDLRYGPPNHTAVATADPSNLGPLDASELEALKSRQGQAVQALKSQQGAALSKLEAQESELSASSAATGKIVPPDVVVTPTCAAVNAVEQLCRSTITKDGHNAIDVSLTRKSPVPLQVEVVASTSTPNATGSAAQPPLDATQLTAIAQAIANQY